VVITLGETVIDVKTEESIDLSDLMMFRKVKHSSEKEGKDIPQCNSCLGLDGRHHGACYRHRANQRA